MKTDRTKLEGFGWLRAAPPVSLFNLYFYSNRLKGVDTQYIFSRKLFIFMDIPA
jgi:hypothetical protein